MGGSRWQRAKISAQKAGMDYARQLLQRTGRALPCPVTPTRPTPQREFEEDFVYEETRRTKSDPFSVTKKDMDSTRLMDRRHLRGVVGFGKAWPRWRFAPSSRRCRRAR